MTHKRNVEGLRRSANQRHQANMERLEQALQQLRSAGKPINFKTVSEVARVSTSWLYQNREVKERITALRQLSSPLAQRPTTFRASDNSKNSIIATLQQRIKKLEAENGELKKQLEVVYGQLYQKDRSTT